MRKLYEFPKFESFQRIATFEISQIFDVIY
jgi:hypothetical protein